MIDMVTVGEAMASLRGPGPLRLGGTMRLSIAGAESNVAIGLARLGHRARWIGRVGDDEMGALVVRTLRAEGVDTSSVFVDPDRATGLLLFERRVSEIVRVSYYRSGSAGGALTADDVLPALDDGARLLHVTGVTLALGAKAVDCVVAAIRRARERGIVVSLDVNFRSRLWSATAARETLRPLIRGIDIMFASEDELCLVATDPAAGIDAAALQLIADGVRDVVVKRGASGADSYTSAGKFSVPARSVPVVDVVGAGDAFVAGYLSALLDDRVVTERVERGVTTAAFAVAREGDWEGLPDRGDLHLLDAAEGTTIR